MALSTLLAFASGFSLAVFPLDAPHGIDFAAALKAVVAGRERFPSASWNW